MRHLVAGFFVAIGTLMAADAFGGSGSIAVEHVWARATPKSAVTGAAYATLINNGTSDDRLLSVTSPAAEHIQIHSETSDKGVMKMEQVSTLDVHPATPVVLKPSGVHMMLIGLKQQLKEGDTVPFTFTFEKAGSVPVTAHVGKIGAMDDPKAQADSGQ